MQQEIGGETEEGLTEEVAVELGLGEEDFARMRTGHPRSWEEGTGLELVLRRGSSGLPRGEWERAKNSYVHFQHVFI